MDPGVQRRVWLKIGAGFGLAFVAAKVVPSGGGTTPPVETLLLSAVLIALATTGALYAVLRFDLGLPTAACLFAVGYNVLVVLVKFVLAPRGYYEVNQHVELNGPTLDDPFVAIVVAATIFALYAGVYYGLYRLFRVRVEYLLELEEQQRRPHLRNAVLAILGGVLLLSGGSAALVLLLPLILAGSSLEYLDFILQSSVSLLVGAALAGAVSLAVLAFRSAAERAQILGDAAMLVSFFWVGLAFLAIYHALWVVYILVLTSIWPLKVVSAK
jgi:hypothetical protein